jgi:hypothetical protein
MSEQPPKIKHEAIPEWAQGLYYDAGMFTEVLLYYDDEALLLEHRGRESAIVRFSFEMLKTLKEVVEEQADSPE